MSVHPILEPRGEQADEQKLREIEKQRSQCSLPLTRSPEELCRDIPKTPIRTVS